MKRARIVVPAAALLLFLFGGWTLRNKLAADRQGQWVTVSRGDLVSGVDVTGTLAAIDSDALGPPQLADVWQFKISMMAPEGSDVKKGTPVLGFDTTELQHRLDDNSALAEQAKKQIEKRRADLKLHADDDRLQLAEADARMRKAALKLEAPADVLDMADRKKVELDYAVSRGEVRSITSRLQFLEAAATAEIRLLESKRQAAESVVTMTRSAVQKMTVAAPRDGTVVYITDPRGEKKKVGDTIWKAIRVIEIPDLQKMKANGEVDEADAGKVTPGQRVTFRLDAHPDDEFRGTIRTVARTVQQQTGTKNPVKVLRVEIAVDRTDPAKMRPGMRFQGTVELARLREAVLIPRNAVFLSDRGPIAYRRGLFSVKTVPLRVGKEGASSIQVLAGLAPGDRVLIEKQDQPESPQS